MFLNRDCLNVIYLAEVLSNQNLTTNTQSGVHMGAHTHTHTYTHTTTHTELSLVSQTQIPKCFYDL